MLTQAALGAKRHKKTMRRRTIAKARARNRRSDWVNGLRVRASEDIAEAKRHEQNRTKAALESARAHGKSNPTLLGRVRQFFQRRLGAAE
jgi:predicted 2-oxoglutarate/Fe(II)-dependent dioxygenase YbiX